MKRLTSLFLLLCSSLAFSQTFQWVREGSGIGQDVGQGVTVDKAGNVYVTGNFSGEATFSGTLFTGNGIFDIFIAKYNPSGNLLWLRSAGGLQNDEGHGITTDNDGNIYVTGYFSETAQFHDDMGHSVQLVSSGNTDIFIAKYDSSGNLLWARKAGGTQDDEGTRIILDAQNHVFLTGFFSDRGIFSGKSVISKGNNDAFIARYDTSGNCQWVQSLGGSGMDKSFGLAADSTGNSYITGFFYYSVSFSNNATVLQADGLSSDIFTVKYDIDGTILWAQRIGGPYNDAAFGIAVDKEESFYITGYFLETATFGDFTLDAIGYNDIFVAKYDSTLDCIWAINEGGEHLDLGLDIGLDNSGNVYVGGTYDSIGIFGNDTLVTLQYYDMFVSKYNDKGIMQWVRHAGGDKGDFAMSICVQDFDLVYATGYYKQFATFGDHETFYGKESDIFITKIAYSVGIDDAPFPSPALLVYPNPSDGVFTLQLPPDIRGEAQLTITDIHGKTVYRQHILHPQKTAFIRMDAPPVGIYIISVKNEKAALTGRIAVTR